MKPLSIALVLASSLSALGLAGCQTTEEDGYYYESSYSGSRSRPPRYVYEESYVERSPSRSYGSYGSYGWAPPPRYASPPPQQRYTPPPQRWQNAAPPPPPPQQHAAPQPAPAPARGAPPPRRWTTEDDPSSRSINEFRPGSR